MKRTVLYYFYLFLFIDLLNGFTIRYLGLNPGLSPGQLIRGLLIMLLIFELFKTNRITKENIYIFLFIFFFPAALLLFIVRDGLVHQIPLEVISFTKPLFFLLLFNIVYTNRLFFINNLNRIMKVNLLIYSFFIIFSAVTGLGVATYTEFYTATKSFFYGNNVTSITGLILCIYYAYRFRVNKINIFYYILAFATLFLSGGKIILVVPFLTILIYIFTGNKNKIKNIATGLILLFISIMFISGNFITGMVTNNSFTQKYYSRAFREAFSDYNRESINIIPLKYYSYASIGRAISANAGINNIINEPENLPFGYGISMRSQKVGGVYAGMAGAEMDIVDMFLDYGTIGFLLIYIPIFKIMWPLLKRRDLSVNAMLVYLLFIYSSLAGHVLTTPMAGSLFALFLGVCGSGIKDKTQKHIFV